MEAILFVNERCLIPTEEQSMAVCALREELGLIPAILNPWQLYTYYTNFHALLFDLKKHSKQVPFLIVYSEECAKDFIKTYPARWLLLKSFFNQVIFLDSAATNLPIQPF
ncbi:hypothetical protein A8F94_22030 [Bacillus sp. FJAT-27225]|uniref:hypothetical protein n=1 Tax=Bacillus sp. FJAT-27225 TaxID=1743144 RepID=UPI00080C337E|nr:hypothetical protein [Bacillus sp. FJAT-27225]OCA81552.1 hypothetical protein A8F94_22030 [Bacillus sp. FJAT-27225]